MRYLLSVLLLWVGVAYGGIDVKTYVPPKCSALIPLIKTELSTYWSTIPDKHYLSSLVEQESCIALSHKRCCDPTSELNTPRELGVGIGQITKAYRKDGSVRFDALDEMRRLHNKELREVSWSNVRLRTDLQVRMVVLKLRDNYNKLSKSIDEHNRYIMANSAYNQGQGGINKDILECRLTAGCNPNVWFGHVEKHCTRSKVAIYGKRSPCDINREHATNVFKVRENKYRPLYE